MKIVRAEILGFCFGVRRAVEIANNALNENAQKKIYSLGPLIHNETTLNQLEKKGLTIVEEKNIDEIVNGSYVIVRAHGISPDVANRLVEKKCVVLDATCPRVKNSQRMVEKNSRLKDFVIFSGDKNHGEVKSIEGYADRNFVLIQNHHEADLFVRSASENKSVLVLSQTTFSTDEFEKISDILKSKFSDIQIENTICPATKERQDALRKLCENVDGVLVIGGKNSANTRRLYQIAAENCRFAAHIQSENDIPPEFFNMDNVGITAGASTPDEIIEKVENALNLKSQLR